MLLNSFWTIMHLPRILSHFSKVAVTTNSRIAKSYSNSSPSSSNIYPSADGFVHSAIEAYSNNYSLIIRPENIWFAIIGQLNFYINRHAEELKGKFVPFEKKKKLIAIAIRNRYSINYGTLAKELILEIGKNVVDPELGEWCMPAFSTATENDKVVASILLIGVV